MISCYKDLLLIFDFQCNFKGNFRFMHLLFQFLGHQKCVLQQMELNQLTRNKTKKEKEERWEGQGRNILSTVSNLWGKSVCREVSETLITK